MRVHIALHAYTHVTTFHSFSASFQTLASRWYWVSVRKYGVVQGKYPILSISQNFYLNRTIRMRFISISSQPLRSTNSSGTLLTRSAFPISLSVSPNFPHSFMLFSNSNCSALPQKPQAIPFTVFADENLPVRSTPQPAAPRGLGLGGLQVRFSQVSLLSSRLGAQGDSMCFLTMRYSHVSV